MADLRHVDGLLAKADPALPVGVAD